MAQTNNRPHILFGKAVRYMIAMDHRGRKLGMPGDGRYQPKGLQPLLGYDNWAIWLIIVEWFWLKALAEIGEMPFSTARLLTNKRLFNLFEKITTTKQDAREYGRNGKKGTNHDINALLILMRRHLPKELHEWLHFGATSYDIINTAYALQLQTVYQTVFWPKLCQVDKLWRSKIKENATVLMMGRTHLQHALPITAGFWLSNSHHRFIVAANEAQRLCLKVPGKFTGAVGTAASQRALLKSRRGEKVLLGMLGLPRAPVTTQITPPEPTSRFYHELMMLSASMANLGDDIRKLVAPEYGEVILTGSAASTSSTMSHKKSNPIGPEQVAGMHVSVVAEIMKVFLTLTSDFQRDLRWSNVMRSYSAAMTYCYKQLEGMVRILDNFGMDQDACKVNFDKSGKLVMAELLHLSLQRAGLRNAHTFVNIEIVPLARKTGRDLAEEMDFFCLRECRRIVVRRAWEDVPLRIKHLIQNPQEYLGDAVEIAYRESKNKLASVV